MKMESCRCMRGLSWRGLCCVLYALDGQFELFVCCDDIEIAERAFCFERYLQYVAHILAI